MSPRGFRAGKHRALPVEFALMKPRSHDWIDARSLALGRAVAERLEANPELLEVARRNLQRWLSVAGDRPLPAHVEWLRLLQTQPLPKLLELLRADDETARRLRQSSPFAGLLSPQDRWRILEDYEARAA